MALLILALTLSGAGRGSALALTPVDAGITIAGIHVPICHAGEADDAGHPADAPPAHDCCDACALTAPAILPDAPTLSRPVAIVRRASIRRPVEASPAVARQRSPRESQGPPAA